VLHQWGGGSLTRRPSTLHALQSMPTLFPAPCTLPLASCLTLSVSLPFSAAYIIAVSSVCNCPPTATNPLLDWPLPATINATALSTLAPTTARLHACTPANHRAPVTLCHFLIRRTPHLDLDACTDKT
jgi:hypothetical protein